MRPKLRKVEVYFDIDEWLDKQLEEIKLYVKDIRAMLNEEEMDDELLSEVYDALWEVMDQIETLQNDKDIVHGVNCGCEDSCLEFFCECGNSWSSNRITSCSECGRDVSPS